MQNRQEDKKTVISLPPLPNGWTMLSADEVEQVHAYMAKKQQRLSQGVDERAADMIFKLKCFLLFTRLKVRRRTGKTQEGDTVFFFRRRGLRYLFENIPMQEWQVVQWIEGHLKWLDHPLTLVSCPYTYIRIKGRKLKAPDYLMGDVTRLQYFTAQNLLSAYWTYLKSAEHLMRNGGTPQGIREQLKQADRMKLRFLACLFTPESMEVEVRTDTSVRQVHRTIHAFDPAQIDDNEHLFRHRADRLFPVMQQFFQSVQQHYARIFPELFTNATGSSTQKDLMLMEVDMLNNIMKYAGFKSYDDINHSNAVLILGVLNNMSKEAKEIKAMNERMKR